MNEADVGEFVVVGETKDAFEEWTMFLFWRHHNDNEWMWFLLERQVPVWRHSVLCFEEEKIAIYGNRKLIGLLNPQTGGYYSFVQHGKAKLRIDYETFPSLAIKAVSHEDFAVRTNDVSRINRDVADCWDAVRKCDYTSVDIVHMSPFLFIFAILLLFFTAVYFILRCVCRKFVALKKSRGRK